MAGLLLLLMTLATFGSCYLTDAGDSSPHNLVRRESELCKKAQPSWEIKQFETCVGDRIEIDDGKGIVDVSKWTEEQVVKIFAKFLDGGFTIHGSEFIGTNIIFNMQLMNHINEIANLTVANNPKLVDFFLEIAPGSNAPRVRISGNRKLNEDSLEYLVELLDAGKIRNDSHIQIYQECDLENQAVANVATTLADCKAIYGDLILDEKTVFGNFNKKLAYVQGCLRITGTKLTSWKDLTFLDGTTSKGGCTAGHEITGNLDMCIHPPLADELKTIFTNMNIINNQKCKGECTSGYFQAKADKNCVIITDTLTINGQTSQKALAALEHIEEIRGMLEVANTTITNFTYLPNLEKLNTGNYSVGAVIRVVYNLQMIDFNLPKLTEAGVMVPRENQLKYHAESNGNFVSNDEFIDRINATKANMIAQAAPPPTTTEIPTTMASTKPPPPAVKMDVLTGISVNKGKIGGISATPVVILIIAAIVFLLFHGLKIFRYTKKLWAHKAMKGAVDHSILYKYGNPDDWNKKAKQLLRDNKKKIQERNKKHLENKNHDHFTIMNHEAPGTMATEIELEDYKANEEKRKEEANEDKKEKAKKDDNANKEDLSKKILLLPVGKNNVYGLEYQAQIGKPPAEITYGTQCDRFCTLWFMNKIEPIYLEDFAATAKRMCHEPGDMLAEKLRLYKSKKIRMVEFGVNFTNYTPKFQNKNSELIQTRKCKFTQDKFWFANHWPIILPCRYRSKLDTFKGMNGTLKFSRQTSKNQLEFVERMVDYMLNMPQGQCLDLTASDVIHILAVIFPFLYEKEKNPVPNLNDYSKMLNARPGGQYLCNLDKAYVRIVGELRGDFDALRRVLNIPSLLNGNEHPLLQYNWVFLGNYTGNHPQSLETILFLVAVEYLYGHECIVLLRGVMEFEENSEAYGFKDYLIRRFDEKKGVVIWNQLMKVFARLPMNCEILKCINCTHGGFTEADIKEKQDEDPRETDANRRNKIFALPNVTVRDYMENADTGAGYYFGERVLTRYGWQNDFYTFFTTAPLLTGLGFFGDATPARLFTISSVKNLHGHGGQKTMVPCVAEVNGMTRRFTFHMMLEEDQTFHYNWQDYYKTDDEIKENGSGEDNKPKTSSSNDQTASSVPTTGNTTSHSRDQAPSNTTTKQSLK